MIVFQTMEEAISTSRYSKKAENQKGFEYEDYPRFIKFAFSQMRHGRLLYFVYFIIDVTCLIIANWIAYAVYMSKFDRREYGIDRHIEAVLLMILVDIFVTIFFNTLNRVPRRRKRKEIFMGTFHICASFVILSALLFSLKQGSDYSRMVIYISYAIYFCFYIGVHIVLKEFLNFYHRNERGRVLLLTSDRFIEEGMEDLNSTGVSVDYTFLLKNTGENVARSLPVIRNMDDAIDVACWKWVDRVYAYGVDSNTIPIKFQRVCWEMKLMFHMIEFKYKVVELKTTRYEDPRYGRLSFLERKDDIPFTIRRVFWITETEESMIRGHHAHKKNCQMLFCPRGRIDIALDDGEEKTTVSLDGSNKGLIIMPCMWHEMIWKESGSILCVLASEYYDPDDYIRDNGEFKEYWLANKRREHAIK